MLRAPVTWQRIVVSYGGARAGEREQAMIALRPAVGARQVGRSTRHSRIGASGDAGRCKDGGHATVQGAIEGGGGRCFPSDPLRSSCPVRGEPGA
jgi:hypothetical protein